MNKLQKFLSKLNPEERIVANELIDKIISNNSVGLNVKKLKGSDNLYRIRKGDLRLIYLKNENGIISILDAGKKNDTTYNF